MREQGCLGGRADRQQPALWSLLPVTLKFGAFGDLTGDGSVGQDDAVVWTREQWPLADWIYRAGLVFKIDSDATSYAQVRKMPLWPRS